MDLGCHCIEISRNFIGKDIQPVEVMCWAATQVHPIDAEDNDVGMVKYANGAIGQFEVSWCFRGQILVVHGAAHSVRGLGRFKPRTA